MVFIPEQDGSCSGFVFSEEWCLTAFLQSVKPPRQLQPHVIQRQLLRGFRSALRQEEMLRCLRQRMLHIILKPQTVQQVFTLSIAECIKGGVNFFVRFLGNINLCAPYLMRCHFDKPPIVIHKTVQRIHIPWHQSFVLGLIYFPHQHRAGTVCGSSL